MTSANRHQTFFIRVLFFLVALCLLQTPASGQDNNAASLKEAIYHLWQFQNDIVQIRKIVDDSGESFGPYTIKTRCTWCSEKPIYYLGFCKTETTEEWESMVSFGGIENLKVVLNQAEQNANTFSRSYAPTQTWIDGLPKFSKDFDSAANAILAVQETIKAGNEVTEQQRLNVEQALKELIVNLDNSSKQLQMGTQALADFLQQQSSFRDLIKQKINLADSSAKKALDELHSVSLQYHCQDGVEEKFEKFKNNYSDSIQKINDVFEKLEASSRVAVKSVGILLGSILNSRTTIESVQDSLNAAKKDQLGGFLEKLHLTTAKKQWKELADSYVK
jgi:hypothetical protein